MNLSKSNRPKFALSTSRILMTSMIVFALLLILACGKDQVQKKETIVDHHGALSVSGNKIVDKNGEPISLRGMSLFWSQIKGKYYNYDCVKWLRDDWKCTIVRAALGVEMADSIDGYLVNKEAEYQKIITVIDAAIDLGIYVLVDLHDHHAHQNKREAIEFFKKIATKYGDKPNIIYEIYNEPMQISWADDVKPYSEDVIKAIRELDPDNIIVAGTTTWSQDVDTAAMDPLNFNNIVYSLHFYASSHKQDLRDKATAALDQGVALFVTEFGTTEYTGDGFIDTVEVAAWFEFMESNSLSWCNWSIGDKDETSAALKPGADAKGGWSDEDINFSGHLVRDKIMSFNKDMFAARK